MFMIKYAFQGLSLEGHISVYYRLVLIHENAKYPRKRIYSKLGPNYKKDGNYSTTEKFLLNLYEEGKEYRIYELRNKILKLLAEDLEQFCDDYVYKDVKKQGYVRAKFILTKKGRKEKEICSDLIDNIEENVKILIKQPKELLTLLNNLGPNIIFLKKVTINKIKKVIPNLESFEASFNVEDNAFTDTFTFKWYESSAAFGGIGGGGGFGGGGGGFGGFGGGSFGGAGSGGGY